MENDVAIVVHSWDNNKKIWPITKHSFVKYWPDRPYHIYFITNFENAPAWYTVKVGEERGFALNTMKALEQVPCDVIIWTLEDYWLDRPVNTELIKKYVGYIKDGKADYIRLFPSENAQMKFHLDNSLRFFNTDCIYKTSLGTSIWRKSLLQRLLVANEDIWQFELNSAKRTKLDEVFLTVADEEPMHIAGFHLMVQNELTQSAFDYMKKEGITL